MLSTYHMNAALHVAGQCRARSTTIVATTIATDTVVTTIVAVTMIDTTRTVIATYTATVLRLLLISLLGRLLGLALQEPFLQHRRLQVLLLAHTVERAIEAGLAIILPPPIRLNASL